MRSVPSERRGAAAATVTIAACPVCGDGASELLLELPAVPVNCSALHHSAADASAAPTGAFRLVLCPACGYVRNDAFDAGALTYDAAYENALDFSPSFRAYLSDLAAELIDRHDLHGRTIVEMGCGQGSFLGALCAGGENRGYGYDPSFRPGDLELPASVEIATELFVPAVVPVRGDLYCARHVLEHIPNPLRFLEGLRPAVAERGAALYLEVPAGEAVFGGDATFDLVYPHVSYFSAPALAGLLGRAGFAVDRIDRRFGGQYLSVEAHAGDGPAPPVAAEAVAAFVAEARGAAAQLDRRLVAARRALDAAAAHGRQTALWGAGAKGVAFLALLDRPVDAVVDINPRKRGSYLPGSGVVVDAPEALAARRPEVVFVLNPMYREEISAMLAAQSISAEVVVV